MWTRKNDAVMKRPLTSFVYSAGRGGLAVRFGFLSGRLNTRPSVPAGVPKHFAVRVAMHWKFSVPVAVSTWIGWKHLPRNCGPPGQAMAALPVLARSQAPGSHATGG